jgi:hypothetical protein
MFTKISEINAASGNYILSLIRLSGYQRNLWHLFIHLTYQ